jgi:hypothetical protein
MRDVLAVILFILTVVVIDSPESVGDWLRQVDEARYVNTMYE